MKKLDSLLLFIGFSLFFVSAGAAAEPVSQKGKLDFVKGDLLPENASHDWNLGPIGARGWCQVSGNDAAGDTSQSRQILITQIDPNGNASGVLKDGDVIIGLGKQPFSSDARIAFAKSISDAESSDGELSLLISRNRTRQTAKIRLVKRPAFAGTAPYACQKSRQILTDGSLALLQQGLGNPSIAQHINALALLATGNKSYLPEIRRCAERTIASPVRTDSRLPCWAFAFANIFLSEYFLITDDRQVLPEIQRLTDCLVKGQGPLGTWGHGFANSSNGRLLGYGAVNAVGLPVGISLVLARECGVEVEGLEESIALSAKFFRRHVGLGAIPYGDGPPNHQFGHDDNGKNSAAAIFFSLLGEPVATRYYARMALASHGANRERGHTGNFFGLLWSLPAVALCGPQATGSWIKKFGWYYDLARDPHFQFRYQGNPRQSAENSYAKWNCPGSYLLHFAVPLRRLRITGRGASGASKLTAAEIKETIECGDIDFTKASQVELQRSLASWSPIVRQASAAELKLRGIDPSPVGRFNAGDPLERIAALRSSRDLEKCIPMLNDADIRVRIATLHSMAGIDLSKALEATLRHLATHADENPVFVQTAVEIFFPLDISTDAAADLLDGVEDRNLALIAIERMLTDEDCFVAFRAAKAIESLPEGELRSLFPQIHQKAKETPAGNVMFGNQLRIQCAKILADRRFHEGLDVSTSLLCEMSWGRQQRLPKAASMLLQYGGHAKKSLPAIRSALDELGTGSESKWHILLRETINQIELEPDPKDTLRSIQKSDTES